jgi:hypothetical protein
MPNLHLQGEESRGTGTLGQRWASHGLAAKAQEAKAVQEEKTRIAPDD